MTWIDIMPSLAQLDVVIGTPVRMRPGQTPVGWVSKNDQTLTVRPWGDEHPTHCLVIDNEGSSMPVPWDSVTIDLEHPLGLTAALIIMGEQYLKIKSNAICNPKDPLLKHTRFILAGDLQERVKQQNQTHREV
tara:strand:- start:248 stop:646 length:399 start_codon:yes stop_codon:yes gene_type:complete